MQAVAHNWCAVHQVALPPLWRSAKAALAFELINARHDLNGSVLLGLT